MHGTARKILIPVAVALASARGGGGGSITNAIKLSVDGSRSVLVYQDEAASVEC